MLGPVAAVPTPGLPSGIVTLLQDKLLPLVLRVLKSHPAGGERRKALRDGQHSPPHSAQGWLLTPCKGQRVLVGCGFVTEIRIPDSSKCPFQEQDPIPQGHTLASDLYLSLAGSPCFADGETEAPRKSHRVGGSTVRLWQSQGRTQVSCLLGSSQQSPGSSGFMGPVGHLRAGLHLDGADLAEAAFHDAGALHEELAALALEALLLPHCDLVLPQGVHGFAAGHAGRLAAGRDPRITSGRCPSAVPSHPAAFH